MAVTGHTAIGRSPAQDGALAALLPGGWVAVSGQITATEEVFATLNTAVTAGGRR